MYKYSICTNASVRYMIQLEVGGCLVNYPLVFTAAYDSCQQYMYTHMCLCWSSAVCLLHVCVLYTWWFAYTHTYVYILLYQWSIQQFKLSFNMSEVAIWIAFCILSENSAEGQSLLAHCTRCVAHSHSHTHSLTYINNLNVHKDLVQSNTD